MNLSGNDYLDLLNDYAEDLTEILSIIDKQKVIPNPDGYRALRSRVITLKTKIFTEITKVQNTPEPEDNISMFNRPT